MDVPISASLGAMCSLLGKLDELLRDGDEGTRSAVRTLRDDVGHIRAEMVKLSEVHDPPLTVNYWMKDARELSYDLEDCVDEFVVRDGGVDAEKDWFGKISRFQARAKEVIERYDRFNLEYVLTLPGATNTEVCHSFREEFWELFGDVGPVGIEGPTHELLRWLNPKSDDESSMQLKVVSILGVDGIGKSTLAQQVWRKLLDKFDCRAFVRAARKPDMRMILRSILSQIRPCQPPEVNNVSNLIHDIRKHLQDKRYFIVIDDIWATSVWEALGHAFPEGHCCSRIIITTAIEDVALACCSYDPEYIFKMKPLSFDDSEELFTRTVFGYRNGCPEQFQHFLEEISKKCGGLPLAIICIGALIGSQPKNIKQWEYVHNFLSQNLRKDPTFAAILKQALKLCYSSLNDCLKTCLLYLSVYPENYTIMTENLVRQWIAEGFVHTSEGTLMVQNAEKHFYELASLGMIQVLGTSHTVHPTIFDFIKCKSIEDNFNTIIDYSQSTVTLSANIHRLSLHFGSATYATPPSSMGVSKVRSLTFIGLLDSMPALAEFKFVRVLILHVWGDEGEACLAFEKISELNLLRYVQIRYNTTIELPDEMNGLELMQILNKNREDSTCSLVDDSLQGKTDQEHRTVIGVASDEAISLYDSSSATSPPIHLFKLLISICIFSRLPEWIQKLRKLCILEIVVRELRMDDIVVIGEFPALRALYMFVLKPTAGHIVFRTGTFPALEYLKVMSGKLLLDFQKEAMPNLVKLEIGFNAHKRENSLMLAGIHHLIKLQKVDATICTASDPDNSDWRTAVSVFRDAMELHPHLTRRVIKWSAPIYEVPTKDINEHDDIRSSLVSDLPKDHSSTRPETDEVPPRDFTFPLLEKITNDFSKGCKICNTAYGEVYKGVLADGEVIAVHKLSDMPQLDELRFQKELNNLMRVQHPNIIWLVGYSYEIRHKLVKIKGEHVFEKLEEKAICFQYFSHGNLDVLLSDESCGLDWNTRYRIIMGTCQGLNYLHTLKEPIFHLDLKPSNILLNEDMEPKIAYFGLSSLLVETSSQSTPAIVENTTTHVPPEFKEKGQISDKYDVFSLGVTIIQIMTGPEGYTKLAEMSPQQFTELVENNWRNRIEEESMYVEEYCQQVKTCLEIAVNCLEVDENKRPILNDVVIDLMEIELVEQVEVEEPQQPQQHQTQVEQQQPQKQAAPVMRRAASIAAWQAAMAQQSQETKPIPSSLKIKRQASVKSTSVASTKPVTAASAPKSGGSPKKSESKPAIEPVRTPATSGDSPKSEPSTKPLPEAEEVDKMAIDEVDGDAAEGTKELDPALDETPMEETIRVMRAKLRKRTAPEDPAGN